MRKPLRAWTFFGIIATICSAIIGLRLYTNAYTPPVSNSIPSSLSFPHVLQSNGRTDLVQWDGYSLFVMHQRIFLCSGEFHTWRLPNVHLWRDILQKIKALGMNAISVYVHWGLTNPAPSVFDFDQWRSMEPLFHMAMQTGLWVILRPGPYINAETTAGGIPHWVTSTVTSHLRTNESSYYEAWAPYIRQISAIASKYQITRGGPIIAVQIENEFVDRDDVGWPGKVEMMVQLREEMIKHGIEVPLTVNDAYMGKNYVNGTGSGDIYGFDSYPQNFDCEHPEAWNPVLTNYWSFHREANPHQPLYIPEFQGGAYDAWGPGAPGYGSCKKLTGPSFESVFNLDLWANNAKMINIYMVYGGTSWGLLPFPGVYTSYDYGAAISENRDIDSPKYAELKRQGLFLRSTPSFYETDVVGNSTDVLLGLSSIGSSTVAIDNPDVFGTLLRNPTTGTDFYIVRHLDSTSQQKSSFRLDLIVPGQIPVVGTSIQLHGRQSKVIVANFNFPTLAAAQAKQPSADVLVPGGRQLPLRSNTFPNPDLLYSTASIFYSGLTGDRHVMLFYGDIDQEHELAIRFRGIGHGYLPGQASYASVKIACDDIRAPGYTIVNILPGTEGLITLWESDEQVVLYADTATTDTFWAPVLEDADVHSFSEHQPLPRKRDPLKAFWSIGTNQSILIGGPHLVRSAAYSGREHSLALEGDLALDRDTYLTIIGTPRDVKWLLWNGQPVQTLVGMDGAVDGEVTSSVVKFKLRDAQAELAELADAFKPPVLENWMYADSLPETGVSYDDSDWVTADNETTYVPYKPMFGRKVLYGCDYGFCEGVVLWRGHFHGTGNETSVRLVINGGEAFAASIYINDVLLRSTYGNSTNNKNIVRETDEEYIFPQGSVVVDGDNVVTVVQDNMGLDETLQNWQTDGSRSPRGIRGYELRGSEFSHWKVQGKFGGYYSYRDKERGIFNEGGLHGERQKWHLPGAELTRDENEAIEKAYHTKRDLSKGLPSESRYSRRKSRDVVASFLGSWEIVEGGHAGVGFFRTTFRLDFPTKHDVMASFEFEDLKGEDGATYGGHAHDQPYRAMLYVNGWMMGKRIGNLGPQTKFPVHEGILDYQGVNTLVIALWAMDPTATIHPRVRLVVDKIYDGGVE